MTALSGIRCINSAPLARVLQGNSFSGLPCCSTTTCSFTLTTSERLLYGPVRCGLLWAYNPSTGVPCVVALCAGPESGASTSTACCNTAASCFRLVFPTRFSACCCMAASICAAAALHGRPASHKQPPETPDSPHNRQKPRNAPATSCVHLYWPPGRSPPWRAAATAGGQTPGQRRLTAIATVAPTAAHPDIQ